MSRTPAITIRKSLRPRSAGLRAGFTLIEVLAALLLLSIALPPLMSALQTATKAASIAKQRDLASNLASGKLGEIMSAQTWQTGSSSGDFSPDYPNFKWQSNVDPWPQDNTGNTTAMDVQELSVTVTWNQFSRDQSIVLSSLVFLRDTTQ
jgi:general secretion pathway protein I